MRELDIAALLCSKVCHDLISPVGALANGLEVLADEDDAEMRGHALALIDTSARTATAKLKFARLAFGAAGSASDIIDLSYAEDVVRGFIEGPKTSLEWDVPGLSLPKDTVRFILNLIVIANEAIPRGGVVRVEPSETSTGGITVTATGPHARLPEGLRFLGDEPPGDDGLDARAIQPFITGLLAREIGAAVHHDADEERVVLTVSLPPSALAA